jgi:hypothetical protein
LRLGGGAAKIGFAWTIAPGTKEIGKTICDTDAAALNSVLRLSGEVERRQRQNVKASEAGQIARDNAGSGRSRAFFARQSK